MRLAKIKKTICEEGVSVWLMSRLCPGVCNAGASVFLIQKMKAEKGKVPRVTVKNRGDDPEWTRYLSRTSLGDRGMDVVHTHGPCGTAISESSGCLLTAFSNCTPTPRDPKSSGKEDCHWYMRILRSALPFREVSAADPMKSLAWVVCK